AREPVSPNGRGSARPLRKPTTADELPRHTNTADRRAGPGDPQGCAVDRSNAVPGRTGGDDLFPDRPRDAADRAPSHRARGRGLVLSFLQGCAVSVRADPIRALAAGAAWPPRRRADSRSRANAPPAPRPGQTLRPLRLRLAGFERRSLPGVRSGAIH